MEHAARIFIKSKKKKVLLLHDITNTSNIFYIIQYEMKIGERETFPYPPRFIDLLI